MRASILAHEIFGTVVLIVSVYTVAVSISFKLDYLFLLPPFPP